MDVPPPVPGDDVVSPNTTGMDIGTEHSHLVESTMGPEGPSMTFFNAEYGELGNLLPEGCGRKTITAFKTNPGSKHISLPRWALGPSTLCLVYHMVALEERKTYIGICRVGVLMSKPTQIIPVSKDLLYDVLEVC